MNFTSSGVFFNASADFPSTTLRQAQESPLRAGLIPYYLFPIPSPFSPRKPTSLFLISYSPVHTYTHTYPKAAYAYR